MTVHPHHPTTMMWTMRNAMVIVMAVTIVNMKVRSADVHLAEAAVVAVILTMKVPSIVHMVMVQRHHHSTTTVLYHHHYILMAVVGLVVWDQLLLQVRHVHR